MMPSVDKYQDVTIDGRTLMIVEWCDEVGIPYNVLKNRIYSGMTAEEAITTPYKARVPPRQTPEEGMCEAVCDLRDRAEALLSSMDRAQNMGGYRPMMSAVTTLLNDLYGSMTRE